MPGQTNLSQVLKTIVLSCDNVEYGFANVKHTQIDYSKVIGTFIEAEGLTVIARTSYFSENGMQFEGPYAKLTIEVQTSLELVGLTAVLAQKLADQEISANVVAGFFHDHIFVQYDQRQKAIDAIHTLRF